MAGRQRQERPPTFDLLVSNMSKNTTRDDVKLAFEAYGQVASVTLMMNNDSASQYGYVRYPCEEDREKALMANVELDGVVVRCKRGTGSKKGTVNMPMGGLGKRRPQGQPGEQLEGGTDAGPSPIRREILIVTHVETPTTFYAQICSEADPSYMLGLQSLSENLAALCPSSPAVVGGPQPGKIYGTIFSMDNTYYRCKLLRKVTENQSLMQFIDYGNTEVKSNSEVVEIPASCANIQAYSQKYVLDGIKLYDEDPDSVGYTQAMAYIKPLLEECTFQADVMNSHATGVVPVILRTDSICVNDEMVTKKFAEKKKFGSQGSNSMMRTYRQSTTAEDTPRIHLKGPRNQSQRFPAATESFGGSSFGSGDNKGISALVGISSAEDDAEIQLLRRKLQEAQQESNHMRERLALIQQETSKQVDTEQREQDKIRMELVTIKGRYKTLMDQVSENKINKKLQNLITSVDRVKMLRVQFPTDGQTKDSIEEAITLVVKSNERVTVSGLEVIQNVLVCSAEYDAAQEKIRACTDRNEVEELIKTRDVSRTDLHRSMSECLKVICSLPLEERAVALQGTLKNIEQTHAGFLDMYVSQGEENMTPDEALFLYEGWKKQMKTNFQEARTITNTAHNAVGNNLQHLRQQLCLDSESEPQNIKGSLQFEDLLRDYQMALDKEIEQTDVLVCIQEGKSDARCIGILLKTLTRQLHAELQDIEHLKHLKNDYTNKVTQLTPWLTDKPSITEVIEIRKKIRNWKSQLRHKLADKLDLEENDEHSGGEMETVKEELSTIRNELQEVFNKEDGLLNQLANLNEHHFPELNIQFPELGLKNQVEYGGLVKVGRGLDQFDVKEEGSDGKKCFTSTNCGKTVFFKEYIVDDSIGIKKSDFLRRAHIYNKLSSPNVLKLDSIFFAQKQAFVLLPFQQCLSSTQGLTEEESCHILHGVLKGLNVLHDNKLTHGAIHPNNVFVGPDSEGILGEVDFSKALRQRSEKLFTTSSGLVFGPPSTPWGTVEEITRQTDMYNFGLLALWVHFRDRSFERDAKGVPDYKSIGMGAELREILNATVEMEPQKRKTPADLLVAPFFDFSRFEKHSPPEDITLQLRPGRSSPSAHGGSILKQKHGSEECVEDNVSEGVAKDDMEGVVQVINQGHIDSSVVTPTLHGHAMDTPANTPAEGQESEVLPNASIDASGFVFKLLNEAKSELSAEENEDSARKTDDNVEPNDGHSVEQETEEKKASGDISSDDDDL